MSLTGVAAANDTYRITLSGSGAAKILDLAGSALDGEYAGTLPSGNGAAGGDFVATFTVGTVQATLQSIQDNVFTPICSTCHTGVGTGLPGSMNLSNATASRAALVSVASVEKPGVQRVLPSNSAGSYIVQKLQGYPGISGSRMPLGGPYLDQPTINGFVSGSIPERHDEDTTCVSRCSDPCCCCSAPSWGFSRAAARRPSRISRSRRV